MSNKIRYICDSAFVYPTLHLSLDPGHEVLHASIDSRDVLASTSDSVGHNSDLVKQEIAVKLLRDHQWATGVSLAGILATLQISSAQDGTVELFLRNEFADRLVLLHTFRLGQNGKLQLLQNVCGIAALGGATPTSDERHEALKVLAANRFVDGQTNGGNAN